MKIKKIISGIMAVLVVFGTMPVFSANPVQDYAVTASADDYTEGTYESLTYEKYSDHIEITGCDESATEVVIPTEIEGLPVTSIGGYAFSRCENLKSITIPDSVTRIYCGAFYDTPWLEAKQKENPLVIINNNLIDGSTCKGDVVIPDGVTIIDDNAFYGCNFLTSIIIPDSVTYIGSGAFYNCNFLTSITIPDSVKSIGSYAFFGTPWLEAKQKENPLVIVNNILIDGKTCEGDIVIPDGVTNISGYVFYQFSGLTSITIPDSVTIIGYCAFSNCYDLTSITILNPNCEIYDSPATITNRYDIGFNGTIRGYSGSTAQAYAEKYGYNFESIGEIEIHESLTYEKYSDHIEITGCDESAEEVVIPAEVEGLPVTSIGNNAFENCESLTSITIPDGVTSIGGSAFSGCSGLRACSVSF